MTSLANYSNPMLSLEKLDKYADSLGRIQSLDPKEICSNLKEIYIEFYFHSASILPSNLNELINYFSDIDHLFYTNVLTKTVSEEDHALYISAIGNFGQLLSLKLQENVHSTYLDFKHCQLTNVLFIIKGPFNLAHMSFAKSFLYGQFRESGKEVNIRFLFLDCKMPQQLCQISFDFTAMTTFNKLISLRKLVIKENIGSIIWPSVAQNVSLYLGSRFAKQQIFWSARYRNRLFDTVDKYFFGARPTRQSIQYNGVSWKYGRFFVAEWKGMEIQTTSSTITHQSDQNWINFIRRKKTQGWTICATISSERKMQDPNFHQYIAKLLRANPHIYYFYTSREKNCPLRSILVAKGLESRFKRINWIYAMTPILSLFDLILDSFPVGASHALCYSLNAGTPFISLYSSNNLQSSLLETLNPVIRELGISPQSIGFLNNAEEYFDCATKILKEKSRQPIATLLASQLELIGGCLNNPTGMYHDFLSHIIS